MDKYVKRIKRKEDDGGAETDADKFYVPGGQWMAADAAEACGLALKQPAAPQKTERPDTPPSPISSVLPSSVDSSKKTIGRMKRNYVSRRLLFDDEEKISVNKPVVNQKLFINSLPLNDDLKEKMTLKDSPYQTIIDSLSARGFVVNNHSLCDNDGESPEQYGLLVSDSEDLQMTDIGAEGGKVLSSSPSYGQFKCLSVFEGIVYSVRVAAAGPAGDNSVETAKVLATIGPHPHIVSYFCNWADARYHYVQTEQCRASLSSLHMNNVADCRTVLEHISCALHYLHDGKKYAHNRVSRPNIYSALDGDQVVYKLGGFDAATKLLPADSSAAVADVQSLCSMVSGLIKDDDGWSADEEDLRQYLLSVEGTVNPTIANALSVWRWCSGARHRPPLLQTRQTSFSAMMYRNVGTDIEDEEDADDQTTVASSLRKINAHRASEIAVAASPSK